MNNSGSIQLNLSQLVMFTSLLCIPSPSPSPNSFIITAALPAALLLAAALLSILLFATVFLAASDGPA